MDLGRLVDLTAAPFDLRAYLLVLRPDQTVAAQERGPATKTLEVAPRFPGARTSSATHAGVPRLSRPRPFQYR